MDLVVGGVPEHFNSPFHLGKQQGNFEKHGLSFFSARLMLNLADTDPFC